MPENRSRKHHQQRLSEALRIEIASIVEGQLADPRVLPATVTEVALPPGARTAYVFVMVHGDKEQGRRAIEGLMAAKGYIRHEVAERLGLRHPPELVFQLDKSDQIETRIDELLGRIAKRRKGEARE